MNVPVAVCQNAIVTPVGEQRLYERLEGALEFELAYYDGERFPAAKDFQTYQGYDYSRDGFGYWTVSPPPTKLAVVRLLYNGKQHYHEARVMHSRILEREGEPCYLVGCKFSIRISSTAIAADESE